LIEGRIIFKGSNLDILEDIAATINFTCTVRSYSGGTPVDNLYELDITSFNGTRISTINIPPVPPVLNYIGFDEIYIQPVLNTNNKLRINVYNNLGYQIECKRLIVRRQYTSL
jgi:hypothetical protein